MTKKKKYSDGYDDEFYFEYNKAYEKHDGPVHPSRPSKLPKDLKIDYLVERENDDGEKTSYDIKDIDEQLEKIFDEQDVKTDSGKFELSRECLVPEEMTQAITQPEYLNGLIVSSIDARLRSSSITNTDFYSNIIMHTRAITELKLYYDPVFPEIQEFVPAPITWHEFNSHLILSTTKNIDEWKFVAAIWDLMNSMTIRQKIMYDLSNSGLSLREIGKLFSISHIAVSDHLKAIKKKGEKMAAKNEASFGDGVDMRYNSLISHLEIGMIIDKYFKSIFN